MSDRMRKMIEEIRKGKDLEVHLPQIGKKMAESYYRTALLDFAMKYTVAYEVTVETQTAGELLDEDIQPYWKQLLEETERNLLAGFERNVTERSVEQLDELRNKIIARMEVLTAYTDILGNYEYVLNRLEPRYEPENEPLETVETMTQILYQYIFDTKDNMTINEKIKDILGQLPVRMTKQKFYDLLRGSMSIYLGSDASSLELYEYMIRTGAMLYRPEGMDLYYHNLQETARYLSELDFEHLDQKGFEEAKKQLEEAAALIEKNVDFYSILTETLNDLYVLVLTAPYGEEPFAGEQEAKRIIRTTCDAFAGNYLSMETYIETISEDLHGLEGRLEEWYEQNERLEAAIEEARIYVEQDDGTMEHLMLRPLYDSLRQCSLLRSGSMFADLTVAQETQEPVTEERLQEISDRLIQDFADAFAKQGRLVRRAVMAETMSQMPVFFNGHQEVLSYIQNALENCSDLAEYNGSIGMLYTVMGGMYD